MKTVDFGLELYSDLCLLFVGSLLTLHGLLELSALFLEALYLNNQFWVLTFKVKDFISEQWFRVEHSFSLLLKLTLHHFDLLDVGFMHFLDEALIVLFAAEFEEDHEHFPHLPNHRVWVLAVLEGSLQHVVPSDWINKETLVDSLDLTQIQSLPQERGFVKTISI